MQEQDYYRKYIKYKTKYFELKAYNSNESNNMEGGVWPFSSKKQAPVTTVAPVTPYILPGKQYVYFKYDPLLLRNMQFIAYNPPSFSEVQRKAKEAPVIIDKPNFYKILNNSAYVQPIMSNTVIPIGTGWPSVQILPTDNRHMIYQKLTAATNYPFDSYFLIEPSDRDLNELKILDVVILK